MPKISCLRSASAGLARFWAPPLFPANSWYFALSTAASAVLALYAAYFLELDNPGSAATTVLIVSSPLHGMVLSKSIWRLAGTLTGVFVSILLIGLADQAPPLFILWAGLWLGLCTFVSSYQRYFRAYAAVLAGYTVSIVALPAAEHPDQIFALATSRLSVVAIGILSIALVKSLFAFGIGPIRIRPALRDALWATGDFTARALDLMPDMPERRRALEQRLSSLDPLVHAAANESAETALQAPAVRLFVTILSNIVGLAAGVHGELVLVGTDGDLPQPLAAGRNVVRDLLRDLADAARLIGPDAAGRIEAARRLLASMSAQLAADLAAVHDPAALATLALMIRFEDIVEELARGRDYLVAIELGRRGRQLTPITYHRDPAEALANAGRALIATLVGGAFWIASAWPSGAGMLSALMIVCALLGTMDRPDLAALAFLRGVTLAGLVAVICQFFVLTMIDGFPLLAVTVAMVVTIAELISTRPKHAGSAAGFIAFFFAFLAPGNPMLYDPVGTLNALGASLAGMSVAVVAYRVLWPVDADRIVRRLIRAIVDDLGSLAQRRDLPPRLAWESRMSDRVARLSTRLAQSPRRSAVVDGGLAALQIGRELMRMRQLLASLHLPGSLEAGIARVQAATRQLASDPDRMAVATAAAARDLLAAAVAAPSETGERPASAAEAGALLRMAAALHTIAELLTRHREFFLLSVNRQPSAIGSPPLRRASGQLEPA
jgi:uncharacterized membrane protein YccC